MQKEYIPILPQDLVNPSNENPIFLEQILFLKYLYPELLLNYLENEQNIRYAPNGVQIKDHNSHNQKETKIFDLTKISKKVSFCRFLIGYNKTVANAFRYSPRVLKILKKTNSHIVSLDKYLKFKQKFSKEQTTLEIFQESSLGNPMGECFSILVTLSPIENVKQQLLKESNPGSAHLEGQEVVLKTTKICKLSHYFEKEPVIPRELIKQITDKYGKLVAITPKIKSEQGKYYIDLHLTTFSGSFLLEMIEKEIMDQLVYKKEITFNHFQLMYYKKVIYPMLMDFERESHLDVFCHEYPITWNQVYFKNYVACQITIRGQKNLVLEFYNQIMGLVNDLSEKEVNVELKISDKIYNSFKESIKGWVNSVETEFENIVFSVHQFYSEEAENHKNMDRNDNRFRYKNSFIIYAIGPQNTEAEKDEMTKAAKQVLEIMRDISYGFCSLTFEKIKQIAKLAGYINLNELEDGFEILLRDAYKKEDYCKPTVVYGRVESIKLFLNFLQRNRTLLNIPHPICQKLLLRKNEIIFLRAIQYQVDLKIHPYNPKIQLSGEVGGIDNITEAIVKRSEDLHAKIKYYEVDSQVKFWIERPNNAYILRYLEKKYNVCYLLDPFSNQDDDSNKCQIGIFSEQNIFEKTDRALEDLNLTVLGEIIEKEIKFPDETYFALKVKAEKAESLGLTVITIGKEFLTVKGYQKKLKKFEEENFKDQKTLEKFYPRYWDKSEKYDIISILLNPNSSEYKNSYDLFIRTMGDFRITRLERIQNKHLINNFIRSYQILAQSKNASKMFLFYGSKEIEPKQIYEDSELGFDLQFSNHSENKGFCFTMDAIDSHKEFAHRMEKDVYQMFIVDVILEKNHLAIKENDDRIILIESGSRCYPLYLIEYEKKITKN